MRPARLRSSAAVMILVFFSSEMMCQRQTKESSKLKFPFALPHC